MKDQEEVKGSTINKQTNLSQSVILAAIIAVALVGIGLIGLLIYFVINSGPPSSTITPTIEGTKTPSPTSTPTVTILAIKSQAKLSTVEYPAVAEIRKENLPDNMIDKFFDRKEQLLMLVYGKVQAGFDLEKLEKDNLWIDGKRVRLVLPAPEILSSSIDFDHTHTVYYENDFLLSENSPNLQKDALAEAQKAIEQKALEASILDKANAYGKLYYENFLRSLGFTQVEVVTNAQVFEK